MTNRSKHLGLLIASLLTGVVSPLIAETKEHAGVNLKYMDPQTRPQDNFYHYANGAWLNKYPMDSVEQSLGTFKELRAKTDKQMSAIMNDLKRKTYPEGTTAHHIQVLMKSMQNVERLNEKGVEPLSNLIKIIDGMKDMQAVSSFMAQSASLGITTPLKVSVTPSIVKPKYMLQINTLSGLTMDSWSRTYTSTKDNDKMFINTVFKSFIKQVLSEFDEKELDKAADAVVKIEAILAQIYSSYQSSASSSPNGMVLPQSMSIEGLKQSAPNIQWDVWVNSLGLSNIDEVEVIFPFGLRVVDSLFKQVSLDEWKYYFKWHAIDAYMPFLNHKLFQINAGFYMNLIRGYNNEYTREQWTEQMTNRLLDMSLGELYVKRFFPENGKRKVKDMINAIQGAFHKSIKEADWMSDVTKRQALIKLGNITSKIAYPKKWPDLTAIAFDEDDLVGNIQRIYTQNFEDRKALLKLSRDKKPIWFTSPQTVNAFYNPVGNEIVFPAAILQPPFFDASADDASNYGAIGMVIGHELGHAFDNSGSRFDATGVYRNWWADADNQAFIERATLVVNEYNKFKIPPNHYVDGKMTLGENIADFIGLSIAYKAYMKKGKDKQKVINGLNGEQRFFVAFGQVWRSQKSLRNLKSQLRSDSHSPEQFRVRGTLGNCNHYHNHYKTVPGDLMYKEPGERIRFY